MSNGLLAGASAVDITPQTPQFLYGYPHVERYSTGIHDPLLSSALYLSDGPTRLLLIANDIIFISKAITHRVRRRISESTGILPENILISASHTHSGPITVDYISNESDPVVPRADADYITFLENGIVQAAVQAVENAQPAQIGLALADSTGIGGNRHDPDGPADHQVPVLMLQSSLNRQNIACLLVCSMHPTVLHEDSTLISADFPGMARKILQTQVLGADCPVLHHTGPAGNQSPRHVTTANTFAEAERLGRILADAVIKSLDGLAYTESIRLCCLTRQVDLPQKSMATVEAAQTALQNSIQTLQRLRSEQAPRQEIRTAECDWFGAEETLTLARAAAENRLQAGYRSCMPAEIQILKIGAWALIGWPGELFSEYALAIKNEFADAFVISLANGELQGYIATPQAAAQGYYEASNALFSPQSGQILVDATLDMLNKSHAD